MVSVVESMEGLPGASIKKVFSSPSLFHGVITWKDGAIDIAPEAVYEDIYAYTSNAL